MMISKNRIFISILILDNPNNQLQIRREESQRFYEQLFRYVSTQNHQTEKPSNIQISRTKIISFVQDNRFRQLQFFDSGCIPLCICQSMLAIWSKQDFIPTFAILNLSGFLLIYIIYQQQWLTTSQKSKSGPIPRMKNKTSTPLGAFRSISSRSN